MPVPTLAPPFLCCQADNTPWQDQSGEARRQLRAFMAPLADHIVEMYAVHGVGYGIYLEVRDSGRYAVIMPTLQRMYPKIMRRLQAIFASVNHGNH